MRTLRYVLCDVFTDRPLTGNALAVFTDGRGVEGSMQAIAREMNLSETVFVLPPQADGQAKLRIFTPYAELPFAGHPTLGSAFVLGGPLQAETLKFETGAGTINLRLEREGPKIAFVWMEQPIPSVRPFEAASEVLSALGLTQSELPILEYDNSTRQVYVIVDSFETVARLQPDLTKLKRIERCINVSAVSGKEVKTRMFAPSFGIAEDPATGGAAGPLAIHLVQHGRASFGDTLHIQQGAEIQRPSDLYATVYGASGRVDRVEVGGAGVVIGRGELRIG